MRRASTRSTTLKQLKLICEAKRFDPDLLAAIRVPGVLYFAGHIISPPGEDGRFPAEQEEVVQQRIEKYFDDHDIGIAFGSVAAGSDIMICEACMRRNIDLHVVLPFNRRDFFELSVNQAGGSWAERSEAALAWCGEAESRGHGSVKYATDGAYLGDDSLFMYAARFAMGLAMLRARNLDTGLRMVAVYDGKGGTGFGTDGSIDVWTKAGLPCDVIPIEGTVRKAAAKPVLSTRKPPRPALRLPEREPRAILFGDVVGFSSLDEEMVPLFHECFMARVSAILEDYGDHVLYRNSWGDAVYVVLDDALTAARCGLEIQTLVRKHDFRTDGINTDLSLRLGGHFGPVFCGKDYIRNEPTYFGSHVTKAARIEPVTPPGELYVTEAMAAALALSENDSIDCDYVGPVPLAKNYGEMRMYVLRRRV